MSSGNWEFYPARVDDAPASIFLNLDFAREKPTFDTLYYVGFELLDPGEHGMGTQDEAELMWPLEDSLVEATESAGFAYVGRLRNHADWQLTFYSTPDRESELESLVRSLAQNSGRRFRLGHQADPDWGYYHGFLWPDSERWQWIQDRRVVHQLQEHGDQLGKERPVDHTLYFRNEPTRDGFLKQVESLDFSVALLETQENAELPYGLTATRSDSVELENIHQIVMNLKALAEEYRGEYDGWGCPVVNESAP